MGEQLGPKVWCKYEKKIVNIKLHLKNCAPSLLPNQSELDESMYFLVSYLCVEDARVESRTRLAPAPVQVLISQAAAVTVNKRAIKHSPILLSADCYGKSYFI